MPIYIQAAVSSLALWVAVAAAAPGSFRFEKNPQGEVRPFKLLGAPLEGFVREYARFTGTPIAIAGKWEELAGSVTVLMRRPLRLEDLTELLHRVLSDNGYAVVDAPAGNGWVIERVRDARDDALPVYRLSELPASSRLVTAHHALKHMDADSVARTLRSFMPPNSRILPITRSQIFVTDTASNMRRLGALIAKLDVPELERPSAQASPPRNCGEHRIERLVVENLEIKDANQSPPGAMPVRSPREGAKK